MPLSAKVVWLEERLAETERALVAERRRVQELEAQHSEDEAIMVALRRTIDELNQAVDGLGNELVLAKANGDGWRGTAISLAGVVHSDD